MLLGLFPEQYNSQGLKIFIITENANSKSIKLPLFSVYFTNSINGWEFTFKLAISEITCSPESLISATPPVILSVSDVFLH